MILADDEALGKKLNSAVFPGMQGGPLMHIVAAKAVAFHEALQPSFKDYAAAVVRNAKALAGSLQARGYDLVTNGTDNHLLLVDLQSKNVTGKDAEIVLGKAHITCNKNGVPFDPQKPAITSGIRLGSPAGTTRGFGETEFQAVGNMIATVLDSVAQSGPDGDSDIVGSVREEAIAMCKRYPIY